MLTFLKNTIKYGKRFNQELMGITFERKPPFYNNTTYTTKIKTHSAYSEDYQDIEIPRKEIIYKFSSTAILHSVSTKDNNYYPRAYMEECKYEGIEHISYFDSDSDSYSDSDFE